MAKLFFSILAGYAIFLGVLSLQVMAPVLDSIDQHLDGNGQLSLPIASGLPMPPIVMQTINEHPLLILRMSEGAVVVLISWSALLLMTHWIRQVRLLIAVKRAQRTTRVARHVAALAARQRDGWL